MSAEGNEDVGAEGVDAATGALHRARAAARARGLTPGAPAVPGRRTGRPRRPDTSIRSGARPDARDPQLLGPTIDRLIADRGWDTPVAVGGVMGRWDEVVGPAIAGHCTPESFTDGVLVVRAESTAWATQIRLLLPTVARRLDEEVGPGTVTRIVVKGPTAPSWRAGRLRAPGAGPRDTYG